MKYLVSGILAFLICGLVYVYVQMETRTPPLGSADLGVCTVTQTRVTIGNQASTEILAESSRRQWALIQQPQNATNTVALSLTGAAVLGQGYRLDPATTTISAEEFRLGFATQLRSGNAVRAITSTGSTTINVTDCK